MLSLNTKFHLSKYIFLKIISGLAPTFGGGGIDPAVAILAAASRIAERRAEDIKEGLSLGRGQVFMDALIRY